MTFLAQGELPLAGLQREAAVARRQAIADFFLHPVIETVTAETLDEISRLRESGCNSIKIFMSSASFDEQVGGFVVAKVTTTCP